MKFNELNILDDIKKAIEDIGYEEATPIQEQAIPAILDGNDIIGQSQTGTGKTAAFGVPILQKVNIESKDIQTIILCPTRELAIQVCDELKKFSKYMRGLKILPVYGGDSISNQIRDLKRGVQIVVGTPGRVLDHIGRKTIKLNNVNTIVLDEADEMLNMGFREDIEEILSKVTPEKQMILFSATMPKPILALTRQYQNNPVYVKIENKSLTTSTIDQKYYEIKEKHKFKALCRLIDTTNPKLAMIFCNTKKKVDDLCDMLLSNGYATGKIHGDMKQNLRLDILDKFEKGEINFLVATDVAARGIDVENVEAVFNYDIPENEEWYVHRIGRTGRAGRFGNAFSFIAKNDYKKLSNIMAYTKCKIAKSKLPSFEEVNVKRVEDFFEKVNETIKEKDLTQYINIIKESSSNEYDPYELAAALLSLNVKFDTEESLELNDSERQRVTGAEAGMTRFYMNIGKNHKVTPRDILGAVAGECGIRGKEVGAIDLFDKYSFVEIPSRYKDVVLDAMNKTKIKGKKIIVEVSSAKKRRR